MISIIIPIYNTGKVLNKCLESVCSQSYRDLEILLINDHSSDVLTNRIAEEWAEKDSRIVYLVNEENQGIEKNRFIALDHAHGDYLMFVDHDDWFSSTNAIELLMNNLLSTNADVVMGRSVNRLGHIRSTPIYDPVKSGVYQGKSVMNMFRSFFGVNEVPVLVWGKIYKMDLVRKAQMKPLGVKYADDLLFNLFVWPFIETFSVVDNEVYIHNYGGLSSRYNSPLKEYHRLYDIRLDAIERFHTDDCKRFLDIEMRNILKFDLIAQYDYHRDSVQLEQFLSREMNDPHWDMIGTGLFDSQNDFDQCICQKDVHKLLNLVIQEANTPKHRLRRLLKGLYNAGMKCIPL